MTTEQQASAFLKDALPMIYRTHLDGKIVFLEGGFHEMLDLLKTTETSFQNIQEVLSALSIDRETIDLVIEDLIEGRSARINVKVTIDIHGYRRRCHWIGTLSKDQEYMQGQLIDIEEFEQVQDKFDTLRALTYGTQFMGERVAAGEEYARLRNLSVMFVDAVDSTTRLFSMELDKAKEYIEDLAEIFTSVTKAHHGFIDKFMGDGAMIMWGYQILPEISCDNHIVDSVLAAKALLQRCQDYNVNRKEIEQIHLRIGIASGEVFSGVFYNQDRMIFTSIGRAVNLAARLEQAAEVDSILMDYDHLMQFQKVMPDVIQDFDCIFPELKGIPYKVKTCQIKLH